MNIVTDHHSTRLEYTCRVMFDCILGVPWKIVERHEVPEGAPVLQYSYSPRGIAPFIIPSGFLRDGEAYKVEYYDSSASHTVNGETQTFSFPQLGYVPSLLSFDVFSFVFECAIDIW